MAHKHGSPARFIAAVTPSDTADLPDGPCSAFIVGVAGTVMVVAEGSTSNTGVPVVSAASQYHAIRARRILSTGTTATSIVALYD